MKVLPAGSADVREITPMRHFDPRGFFAEILRVDVLRQHGITAPFVQENHSLSAGEGVVRGLHFQIPPMSQAKLVRVTAGAIFDVAVDLRHGSADYGRYVGIVLSAAAGNQ